jgi:hypothetical protein
MNDAHLWHPWLPINPLLRQIGLIIPFPHPNNIYNLI